MTHEELNMIVRDLNAMRDKLEVKDMVLQKYDEEIYFLKNPPMTFACAAHYEYQNSISGQVIPFTNLLYSATNVESVLDIATGKFTAGHPGSYTATWSMRVLLGYKGTVDFTLFLRKNGENIFDSVHFTYHSGPNRSDDYGGRTLVLHLEKGDTLDLYCDRCDGFIANVSFCVSLSQFDVV